jgi:hypothetical protein
MMVFYFTEKEGMVMERKQKGDMLPVNLVVKSRIKRKSKLASKQKEREKLKSWLSKLARNATTSPVLSRHPWLLAYMFFPPTGARAPAFDKC